MTFLKGFIGFAAVSNGGVLPAFHLLPAHVRNHLCRVGVAWGDAVGGLHIEVAARPVLVRVLFAIPRRASGEGIEIVGKIVHRVGFKFQIKREATHGLRQSLDAAAESRTDGGRIDKRKRDGGRGIRHHYAGLEVFAVGRRDASHAIGVRRDGGHAAACQELSSQGFEALKENLE